MKNHPLFILKNSIAHSYEKLQPQMSAFMENSICGINRDPCLPHLVGSSRNLENAFRFLQVLT